jgi:hypothetical protein
VGSVAPHAQLPEQTREHREAGEADDDVRDVGSRAGPEDLLYDVRVEEADDPPLRAPRTTSASQIGSARLMNSIASSFARRRIVDNRTKYARAGP